jgi:tRNA(Ile)-lysidine synthase
MVLLEGVSRLLPDPALRARLLVLHVNHGLRGAESDGDEALVLRRAAALGLTARAERLEWGGASPSQDACRRKRDALFRGAASRPGDRVWLAHHRDDQAETVFLRLLRGTGARGLKGMLAVNGIKVRPFLALEKGALLAAAEAWGVPWREDSSNRSAAYDRNWLRGIFVLLEERRPGFRGRLAALAGEAQGWRFPPEDLSRFSVEGGIEFARPRVVPASATLASAYALPRRHALALRDLLGKPSGSLHAEGAKFTWSGGVLLREAGASFRCEWRRAGEAELAGTLGAWRVGEGVLAPGEGRGEALKKEFQALRVPRFFRAGVPLVQEGGRPVALLPRRLAGALARREGLAYVPSPLAAWWLEGGAGQRISRE